MAKVLQLLAAATSGRAAFCIVNMRRHSPVSWELRPSWMILHFTIYVHAGSRVTFRERCGGVEVEVVDGRVARENSRQWALNKTFLSDYTNKHI